MDESDADPRLPHHLNPKEFVPLDHLAGHFYILRLVTLKLVLLIILNKVGGGVAELGVLYWRLNPNDYEKDEQLRQIRETRGYNYMVFYLYLSILSI